MDMHLSDPEMENAGKQCSDRAEARDYYSLLQDSGVLPQRVTGVRIALLKGTPGMDVWFWKCVRRRMPAGVIWWF